MKNNRLKSLSKLAACCLSILLILSLSGCKSQDYEKAVEYFGEGKLEAAEVLFENLQGYEDSLDYLQKIETMQNYEEAVRLFKEGSYEASETLFLSLNGYEDSQEYLDQMGWFQFHGYLESQGPMKVHVPDELDPNIVVELSASGKDICAVYDSSSDTDTAFQLSIRYEVRLEHGNPNAELAGGSNTQILLARLYDVGTVSWRICDYTKNGPFPKWDHYVSGVEGTDIYGNPIKNEHNLALCEDTSGGHSTSIQRLTAGIEIALKESGLSTTMADLGFTNYEE